MLSSRSSGVPTDATSLQGRLTLFSTPLTPPAPLHLRHGVKSAASTGVPVSRHRPIRSTVAFLPAAIGLLAAAQLPAQPTPIDPAELPRWVNQRSLTYSIMSITFTVSWNVDLALTSDPQQQWVEYEQAKQEFQRWFEETKERLENEFNSASGDAQITAGRALVEFVLEAMARWDRIKMPTSGTWSGPYRQEIRVRGLMRGTFTASGDMTLTLEEDAPGSSGAKAIGELTTGLTEGEMLIGPPGQVLVAAVVSSTWEADALGSSANLESNLLLDIYQLTSEGGVVGPFFAVVSYSEEGRMTVEAYLTDDLRRLYLLDERTVPFENRFEEPLTLWMAGREEELDLTELLHQYFQQYVVTIDQVKSSQFSGAGDFAAKRDKARETFELCLEADALGDAANIPLGVKAAVGLSMGTPASLFDKWFERFFTNGVAAWDERAAGAGPTETGVNVLLARFNFVTEHIDMASWIISDALIEQLELEFGSPLVDRTYEPYYTNALGLWISRLQQDATLLQAALDWLDPQASVGRYGVISDGLASSLGLLTEPPRDAATLTEAAGGGS